MVEASIENSEEVNIDAAMDWIYQAAGYHNGRIRNLCLTGGEPFCNPQNLLLISSYADRSGLSVAAETNAFWASSRESALDTLQQFPALQSIAIGTDVYHQQFIPFSNIRNALWAAKELHRRATVELCTDKPDEESFHFLLESLLTLVDTPDDIAITTIYPVGRASRLKHNSPLPASDITVVPPCSKFGAPVVFPDGRVMACAGPLQMYSRECPLFLGSLLEQSLEEILERAEMNPVLHIIRIWGPHKLLSLIREYGFDSRLPKREHKGSHCELCFRLLRNEKVVGILEHILQDQQIRHVLAYARMHYLEEPAMIQNYRLNGSEQIDLTSGASFADW
jgi:organic radical activating enzyme